MNRFAVTTDCKVRTLRTRSDSCDSDRLADDIQNSAHRSDQHDLREDRIGKFRNLMKTGLPLRRMVL